MSGEEEYEFGIVRYRIVGVAAAVVIVVILSSCGIVVRVIWR
jgi:hypothetical protein